MKPIIFLMLALLGAGDPSVPHDQRDDDDAQMEIQKGNASDRYTLFSGRVLSSSAVYRLAVSSLVPFPEGRFEIVFDGGNNNVLAGFLRPREIFDADYPLAKAASDLRELFPESLEGQTRFYKKGVGWVRLTLAEATRLWGTPRKRNDFYTFDARNYRHGEENIFHLDFVFDEQGFVETYRVRGPGLAEPSWIVPKVEFFRGRYFLHKGTSPPKKSEPISAEAPPVGQIRLPVQCGKDGNLIDFCIRNGKGWIEVNDHIHAESDQLLPNWFYMRFIDTHRPDWRFHRPTLKTLSDWWGVPRAEKAGESAYYAFDVKCEHDGEPDIFHVDVMTDKDLAITQSRLRGPGIAGTDWQNSPPPPEPGFFRR